MSMKYDAPFIPAPMSVVREALRIACVGPGDTLYDLGAGDGRVVVEAALRGAHAVAVEIDPFLCEVIRSRAEEAGVGDRVEVLEASFYDVDVGAATVVYMYLYRSINEKLAPMLEERLRPGARVVTVDFPIPGWVPVRVKRIQDEGGVIRTILLYIIGISNPAAHVKRVAVYSFEKAAEAMGCRG